MKKYAFMSNQEMETTNNNFVRIKNSTTGITLIALVVTIVVLLVLAGVSIAMLTGDNGILTNAMKAKEATEAASIKEQIQVEIAEMQARNNFNLTKGKLESILTKYGTVNYSGEEITGITLSNGKTIELTNIIESMEVATSSTDGHWNGEVNVPDLDSTAMTPVTFTVAGEATPISDAIIESSPGTWYDYAGRIWANAQTTDGSLWVWIPRYEYKITYTNANDKSQGGTIDVKFIKTSQTTPDSGYIIHPAFTNGTANNFKNGEWDQEIAGFWVAKYPAGYQQNTITDNGNNSLSTTISNSTDTLVNSSKKYTQSNTNMVNGSYNTNTLMSYPVFKPLTYAYNVISIGDSYTLAKEVAKGSNFYGLDSSSTDSHLMKNSEWGAVAYLTHSIYGRATQNGSTITTDEPNINNYYTSTDSPYRTSVTGLYTNSKTSGSTTTLTNAYYSEIGQKGSSTGNQTGVYDLNGCVWERTAGYITNGNSNLRTYGKTKTDETSELVATYSANADGYKTLSTKYATVYPYDSTNDSTSTTDQAGTGLGYFYNWKKYKELSSAQYGYGDAVLETAGLDTIEASSLGNTNNNARYKSWNGDYSVFPLTGSPFFVRGGLMWSGSGAGSFAFNNTGGNPYYNYGFRVVLVGE